MQFLLGILKQRNSGKYSYRNHRRRLRGECLEERRLLATVTGDFNGDGLDDMAWGSPGEDVGSKVDAGAVNVIYGSPDGLSANAVLRDQVWHQNRPDIEDTAEADDRFGSSLAAADFNNDGFDDLAIGVPGEDIGSIVDGGAVNIIYGSPAGLSATAAAGDQFWHQDTHGVLDTSQAFDHFGEALAVGDFNDDGRDDLAVGVPGEDIGSMVNAGAVNVIYGRSSTHGLTASSDQFWHQDRYGILDDVETGDAFGSALATGDFNRDGRDDLAIGVPREDLGFIMDAGAVNVLYGRSSYRGLKSVNNQIWHENNLGGRSYPFDNFGSALATGDFNGNGRDDLAVGVPGKRVGSVYAAGAVSVIYGRDDTVGLTFAGDQLWHRRSVGILGNAGLNDRFGTSLTSGDFNGDGRDDLVVGVPKNDLAGSEDAGAVNVIYGSIFGLTAYGNQIWSQAFLHVGQGKPFENFGACLAAGDFDGDGRDDLAIGIPHETITPGVRSTAVDVLYGRFSHAGLYNSGSQLWHQDSPRINGQVEVTDLLYR